MWKCHSVNRIYTEREQFATSLSKAPRQEAVLKLWSHSQAVLSACARSSSKCCWPLCSGAKEMRMWARGRPRFWNSTTWTLATTRPKICFSFTTFKSCCSLPLKTRATSSGRIVASWPGKRFSIISLHWGLVVIVTNRSGCKPYRTNASCKQHCVLSKNLSCAAGWNMSSNLIAFVLS